MNSTTKIPNRKMLLLFAFIIIFYHSYISCQTSSVYYYIDMPEFNLPMDKTKNFDNVKIDYHYSNPEKSFNLPKTDCEVELGSTDIEYYGKSSSGITDELYDSEESENEMLIEDWMTEEFKVKSDLSNGTSVIEEEMELEEWMIDPFHWKLCAKKLSCN